MTIQIGELFFFQLNWFISATIVVFALGLLSFRLVAKARKRKKEKAKGLKKVNGNHFASSVDDIDKDDAIAIVSVQGAIMSEPSIAGAAYLSRGVTFGNSIRERFIELSKNDNVKGVIVRFNTPGGMVGGSAAIAEGITVLRDAGKLVYAHVVDMSCSGGVMGMVPSDKIYAEEGAMLGSIGVRGPTLFRYHGVTEKYGMFGSGVKADLIEAQSLAVGKGKNFGDPFSEPEPEVAKNFEDMLDRTYTKFKEHVHKWRGIAVEELNELGAQVVDELQAKSMNLIDEIGTLDDVKSAISVALGKTADDYTFVQFRPKKRSALQGLLDLRLPEAVSYEEEKMMVDTTLRSQPILVLSELYWR